jgi:hypothetical protein
MLKRSPLPGPASWLSAVVLFVFTTLVFAGVGVVLPAFLEFAQRWPRLGALGGLGLVLSPGLALTLAHHAAKGVLDRAEKKPAPSSGLLPTAASVWAGLFGWCVVVFSLCVSTFVSIALFPRPPEPDALLAWLSAQADPSLLFSVRTAVWVVAAACAYEVESRNRASS